MSEEYNVKNAPSKVEEETINKSKLKIKNLIFIFISLVFVVGIVGLLSIDRISKLIDDSVVTLHNIIYEKEGDEYVVKDFTYSQGDDVSHIEIVSGINGYEVTKICSQAFAGQGDIKSIKIPNTVKVIEDDAFINSNIQEVQMPSSLEYLGAHAFENCPFLEEITIPKGISEIKAGTFLNCSNLKKIHFNDDILEIGAYSFANCSSIKDFSFINNAKKIGGAALMGCESIEEITLNFLGEYDGDTVNNKKVTHIFGTLPTSLKTIYLNNIEIIPEYCFDNCKYLENIIMIDTIEIHDYAFNNCESIKEIVLPNTLQVIGKYLFRGCTNLEKLSIPFIPEHPFGFKDLGIDNSVIIKELHLTNTKIVRNSLFKDVTNVEYIYLNDGIEVIEDEAFYRSSIKGIKLPSTLVKIGNDAFILCDKLEEIIIPDTVNEIGYDAFRWCSSLVSIILPNQLVEIKQGLFAECVNLKSIVIPNDVTIIGSSAFKGCSNLENFNLPLNLERIESDAFSGCSKITNIELGDNLLYLGGYAFNGCSLTKLHVPSSTTCIDDYAFKGLNILEELELPYVDNGFTDFFGVNYESVPNSLIKVIVNNKSNEYTYSFYKCSSIKEIVINGELSYLGKAFYECSSLEKVTLPSSLKVIEYDAFCNCSSLKEISGLDNIEEIRSCAFYGCISLGSITLPSTIIEIGGQAFFNCSNITIYIDLTKEQTLNFEEWFDENATVYYQGEW